VIGNIGLCRYGDTSVYGFVVIGKPNRGAIRLDGRRLTACSAREKRLQPAVGGGLARQVPGGVGVCFSGRETGEGGSGMETGLA